MMPSARYSHLFPGSRLVYGWPGLAGNQQPSEGEMTAGGRVPDVFRMGSRGQTEVVVMMGWDAE